MNYKIIFLGILSSSLIVASGCSQTSVKTDEASAEPAPTIAVKAEPKRPLTLQMVHFDFNSSTLSDDAKMTLKSNADALVKEPNLPIKIEGYCDERGGKEYNLALGQRRAMVVKEYLASLGVSADRISVISYGKAHPLDSSRSEGAYTKNRRAAFTVLGQNTNSENL